MCEAPFHESALWFIANAGRKKTKLLPIIINSVCNSRIKICNSHMIEILMIRIILLMPGRTWARKKETKCYYDLIFYQNDILKVRLQSNEIDRPLW